MAMVLIGLALMLFTSPSSGAWWVGLLLFIIGL